MDDIERRNERIRLETTRHRIVGLVSLARDGYRSRVSDLLNASERDFLVLTEVTVEPLDGGPQEEYPFMVLARGHIVFAVAVAADEPPAVDEPPPIEELPPVEEPPAAEPPTPDRD
jgi:hypothetical protein